MRPFIVFRYLDRAGCRIAQNSFALDELSSARFAAAAVPSVAAITAIAAITTVGTVGRRRLIFPRATLTSAVRLGRRRENLALEDPAFHADRALLGARGRE